MDNATDLTLAGLTNDEKLELLKLLELRDRRRRENWLKHYRPYPRQREFHRAGAKFRERLFMAANQGHPIDFKILTPAGWRAIGDLAPGDEVIAGDGTPCRVAGVVDLGVREIFEVSLDAGNLKVLCTDDHLWAVRSPQRDRWAVETTVEVAARKMKPRTPGCSAVQFPRRELPVPPYLLGVLIGNGSFTNSYIQVSTNDQFVLDEIRPLLPETCTLVHHPGARDSDWHIRTEHQGRGRRNDLLDHLEALGLRGKRSEEKRVPSEYLLAAPEQRLDLLQGLMDTDGGARKVGPASVRRAFYTSSPGLAEDVAFLVRSLGGQARVARRAREKYKHPRTGEMLPCLPSFVVDVRLPDGVNPFRMPRKAGVVAPEGARMRTFDHTWDGVVSTGRREPARCIRIDHPSRLYICEGFVVTHNCGKTYSGAAEVAFHATGAYPEDWDGYRFPRPIRAIVGSASGELTRKGVQRLLLGPPEKREEWGTGAIPKSHLTGHSMKPGVPDAVSSITVKNEYGGESVIQFNSYDQGREKWQADTVDLVWMDEEPPLDIYTEALTRTNTTGGLVFVTFTPLLGMSLVVKRFLQERSPGSAVINMTIDDVDHYTAEQKAAIIATYPEHERDARTKGVPMLGSGAVFPVAESAIAVDPFPLPAHWPRICGMDFGIDHPAAFAVMAHDRDTDTVYLYDSWRVRGKSVAEQSMIIVGKGYQHLPWAWPHDGMARDKGSGQVLVQQYKNFGINTLNERAQFERTPEGKPGGNGVEAGLSLMLERMQTGRFKVFRTQRDFFEEMRMLHRKDGQVVKLDDDLTCLHPDTQVLTRDGPQRIVDLVGRHGEVLTTDGVWAPFRACRRTRRDADLVRVTFSDGHELLCTPDHLLLSDEGDWVQALDSKGLVCHDAVSKGIQWTRSSSRAGATRASATTTAAPASSFIARSGRLLTDLFRRATTFITRTATETTTRWTTWRSSWAASTSPSTRKATSAGPMLRSLPWPSGARPTSAGSACARTAWLRRTTFATPRWSFSAPLAARSPCFRTWGTTGSAPTPVSRAGDDSRVWIWSALLARYAVVSSRPTASGLPGAAAEGVRASSGWRPPRAGSTLSVLRVQSAGRSDVYCMEVPGANAFALANGAVVHNCATRYAMMMLRRAKTLDEVDQKPKSLLTAPLTAAPFEVFDPLAGY